MKVMIGAVTALTAAVTFGDLVSANVVGYAKTDVRKGFSAVGAQFIPVAAEKMDLCDIIPVGYDKDTYEAASIYIQSLDAYGKTVAGSMYYWYDQDEYTGWISGSGDMVNKGDRTYAAGEALWVHANSTAEGMQTAGQVANGSIDVMLRKGFKLVCNPTPVAIPFNNDNSDGKFVAPGGYDYSTYEPASIYVQKLSANGKTDGKMYYWYDQDEGTMWIDGDGIVVEKASLKPGEALWVHANSENEKINFPAAL